MRLHGSRWTRPTSHGSIELHDEIVKRVRDAGYRFVTLDLRGYRSGSLNEGLSLTLTNSTRDGAERVAAETD